MKSHQRFIRDNLAEVEPAHQSDIATAEVREIDFAAAREIIERYEWLKKMPAITLHCFGIFFDGNCGGVVVYSNEYAENLGVWDRYGFTGKIICLARGACVHWAHPHSASKLIRTSMRMLPERYKVVTATVDVTAGELGTIYQACGFDFVGTMSKGCASTVVLPDGKRISEREAYRQYGTRSAQSLREMGLDVRSVPRKGRYFAFLGNKRERTENRSKIEHLMKPYPKRPPQSNQHNIQINPEFRALIGPLTRDERQQLEANLVSEGCRDPLVTWRGILLDGHNRFEICERRGIPYKTVEIDLSDDEAAKLWIEEHQIGRRNLSSDQRAAIAYRIMQRRVAISKQERARKGGTARSLHLVEASTTEHPATAPRQREIAAARLGVSPHRLRIVSEIAKAAPMMIEQMVAGTLTVQQAKEQVAERERRRQQSEAKRLEPDDTCIHVGDPSLLGRHLRDGQVDLFLTEVPEEKLNVALCRNLAVLADKKLKMGGLCAVVCSPLAFDQVFTVMRKRLEYYWVAGMMTKSKARSARILHRRVVNAFRLVSIFAKRPVQRAAKGNRPFMSDVIPGENSAEQVRYLVEHLARPGQLVVDPLVGRGDVAVACFETGRRFVGTENDPSAAVTARKRLKAAARP